jgi:hypothetical protein
MAKESQWRDWLTSAAREAEFNHKTPQNAPGLGSLGIGLAPIRCPQPSLALSGGLLRMLVAPPLVGGFQPRKLLGIHGLELGSLEFAIGRRRLGPAGPRCRRCVADRDSLPLHIAGAAGGRQCAQYEGKGERFRNVWAPAGTGRSSRGHGSSVA